LRKVPVKLMNTTDGTGADRNVSCCKFYSAFEGSDGHCYCFHDEVIDLDSEIKVDYRRCAAYKFVKNVMRGLE